MSTVTGARRTAPKSNRTSKAAVNGDCCRLCGAHSEGTYRSDLAHFKAEHPAYYRGLRLRVAAPLVFVVLLVAAGTVGAPTWALVAAIVPPAAILVLGISITRRERGLQAASGPGNLIRMVKDGGWRFVIIPVAILTLIAFGRH